MIKNSNPTRHQPLRLAGTDEVNNPNPEDPALIVSKASFGIGLIGKTRHILLKLQNISRFSKSNFYLPSALVP
jgi:hypothetical protein